MKKSTKKLAFLSICTSLALVFAYVEAILPPVYASVPGIKLGLPNIVIIFVLYRFGFFHAACVSLVRICLVSLLFGNPVTLAYSAAGGALSLLCMALLRRTNFLSEIGVSVAGGVLHNVGQVLVAMLLLGTAELGYYLAVLAVSGTAAGVCVGICGALAVRRIPDIFYK